MASDEIKKLAVKMAEAGYCNAQACEEYLEAAESLGYERAKEDAATLLDAQYAAYKAREEAQADNSYWGFWLEVRRAIARWTGVMIASVVCGLLLGLLRQQGIPYKQALEMALPVGFLLALLSWVWFSRRFLAIAVEHPVEYPETLYTVVEFDPIPVNVPTLQAVVFTIAHSA